MDEADWSAQTVVAGVSLDMLRSRRSGREEPMDAHVGGRADGVDPGQLYAAIPAAGLRPAHGAAR